jgi:hypothetical protein
MKTEYQKLSAQFINSNFVKKVEQGRIKEAEDEGSRFIRSRMRQDSFAREILNPVEISADELDRDVDTDQPKKIIEKEPDSVASFVTFKGAGQKTIFRGPRYSVYFGKVESQHFTKSKFELMTYQNDIRKILTDNSVKDMADEEDRKFIETVDSLATTVNNVFDCALDINGDDPSVSGLPPITNGELSGGAVRLGIQKLLANKIPLGKILMSKSLYYRVLDLPATTIGDQVAMRHYDEGVEAEQKLFGFPVVTTIKEDIVGSNDIYFFGPQEYLGNFFLLQDATLFIKQEADMIEFWSYSAPGIGIGNANSIVKLTNVIHA